MKKLTLLLVCLALVFSLAGCMGSNNETNGSTPSATTSSKENTSEGIVDNESSTDNNTTDGSNTSDTGSDNSATNGTETGDLKDGKYTAEADTYDDEGYKPFVELTVKNGKVSEIDLDAVNSKGDYKKDSNAASDWIDKMMLFEKEIVVKGLEAIDFNEDGTVDGIEGFDLNVGDYTKLINEAISKAKKGNSQ